MLEHGAFESVKTRTHPKKKRIGVSSQKDSKLAVLTLSLTHCQANPDWRKEENTVNNGSRASKTRWIRSRSRSVWD